MVGGQSMVGWWPMQWLVGLENDDAAERVAFKRGGTS